MTIIRMLTVCLFIFPLSLSVFAETNSISSTNQISSSMNELKKNTKTELTNDGSFHGCV